MARFGEHKERVRAYFALLAAFYVLALAAVSLKDDFDFAVSDGRFYYAYLPSVVLDGDLDFENQIAEHWGTDFDPALLEDRTRSGYVQNKYSIGLALTLSPSFLAAHGASLAVHGLTGWEVFFPNGYSVLYQLANLALVVLLGLTCFLLIERILVERMGIEPPWVFAAVCLFWTGSHYAYYYFREPLMVHVVSAFWVTACMYLAGRQDRGDPPTPRLAWAIGLTASMAIVSRPTNGVVLLPFLAPLVSRSGFVRTLPAYALGGLPILAQLAVWRVLHGSWVHYSYHSEGFIWLEPHLVATLFSSKHGLFFWAPILLLSVVGWILGARSGTVRPEARRTFLQLAFAALCLWYVNSCWHQWWFGDAFGARAFLELSPLFVLGLAWFLRASSAWPTWQRRTCWAFVAASYAVTWGLMALYVLRKIPRADYLF